uniref:Paxillin n=2 Tax=Ascaris TaxID=6251 RepID=F1LAT1_ASCSU
MAFRGQLLYTLGNAWHREHFRCIRCHCRVGPDGREFRACRIDETLPLCIDCHMEENHPKCAGCKKTLRETCVKALDKQWHRCCLVCAKCQSPFPNLQFYIFNGKPYDTDCFYLTKYDSLLTPLSQIGNIGVEGGQLPFDQMFANMPTGSGLEPIVTTNKANTQGPPSPIPDASLLVNSGKDLSVSTASSGTSIADTKAESSSSTISTQIQHMKT